MSLLDDDRASWSDAIRGNALEAGDFIYVYDCGAEPAGQVREAVRQFVDDRAARPIDMLVLSHLDRDHICGVPTLLAKRKGVRVDTIVLPYLDDVDRLIAFGRSASTLGSDAEEAFSRDLVVDPVRTLRRFDPRQIILIPAADEEGRFDLELTDPPSGTTGGGDAGEADGIGWQALVNRGAGEALATPDGATVLRRGEFILGRKDQVLWRLKPYVRRARPEDREAFRFAVEVALDWPRGSFDQQVQAPAERRKLVTRHRMALARAYKWAFGDKNETSLSLYSGPAKPGQCGAVFAGRRAHKSAKVGWLGTGDAYLREADRIAAFERHFSDELDHVATFVLPHHGSIHNNDPARLVSDADLFIACAQPIHNWRHPDPLIVSGVKARAKRFRLVNAQARSTIHEKMVVFVHGERRDR